VPGTDIMGILNATPDSFATAHEQASVERGLRMIGDGATILDIGGESTRPGAAPVTPAEEQARVLPLISALAGRGVPISIDTRHASTMRAALAAGADIVNDVTGLQHDPEAAGVVARAGCRVVLMHMRGTPQTMSGLAHYGDVVAEVMRELAARVAAAERAGIARGNIIIDPGLGFAKTAAQSLVLLRRLDAFAALGLPLLVGASRKSFVGAFGQEADPARRGAGSLAAALFALARGAAILRVHDVAETAQAVRVWTALAESGKQAGQRALPLDPTQGKPLDSGR
jgi:dihydropteroate synthase